MKKYFKFLFLNINDMKPVKRNMVKIYNFSRVADQDLVIEVNERQMIPKKMRFAEFEESYQRLHKEKYGKRLKF